MARMLSAIPSSCADETIDLVSVQLAWRQHRLIRAPARLRRADGNAFALPCSVQLTCVRALRLLRRHVRRARRCALSASASITRARRNAILLAAFHTRRLCTLSSNSFPPAPLGQNHARRFQTPRNRSLRRQYHVSGTHAARAGRLIGMDIMRMFLCEQPPLSASSSRSLHRRRRNSQLPAHPKRAVRSPTRFQAAGVNTCRPAALPANVDNVGGELTMINHYSAAGAVLREVPAGRTCVAHAIGFRMRLPPAAAPPTSKISRQRRTFQCAQRLQYRFRHRRRNASDPLIFWYRGDPLW